MIINTEIENESGFPRMKVCIDDVNKIWIECGEPETVDGPTTEIHGFNPHTSDMGDGSTEGDIETYNSLIDDLYALIDYIHIGSGIWYTQYNTNDAREKYETEAKEIIDAYVNNNLWDEFCGSTLWETIEE